ncbi:metallophosphoesterase [Candidatus Dojkabacteria bacterium]|uniref:Metallophosphoesterase n=1 Tax=Candidatus Dojkabacteria bacterium TaxID=2099670 RepID=A0A955KWP7_9BACT|nr:metallophosphoesterase [Candidatus Dojkabacteria bacterium]
MKPGHYVFLISALIAFVFCNIFLLRQSINIAHNSPVEAKKSNQQNHYVVILGDSGTGSSRQYDIGNRISRYCKKHKCYSAFIAGDVIYNNGVSSVNDLQFKTKFEDPYSKVNLVFNIAYGNHDYNGCTKCYLDYSDVSPKWNMPFKYYKVSYPDVDYFVINTEKFTTRQQKWLKSKLKNSKAKWKVVIGHKPLTTFDSLHVREKWDGRDKLKSIICRNADVYVSGHAHLLEDIGKVTHCTVKQLISGGGGANTRHVVPNKKDKFVYEGRGFLTMGVVKGNLTYGFRNIDGLLLRKVVLKKK